ncbi:MAG: protoglobin domain-containing protein [Pseudomonadota bacterium]
MSITKELFQTITRLIDYREADWQLLKDESATILNWSPEIVAVFYQILYDIEETRAIFQEGERPKLEKNLSDWIASMVNGPKGDEFWEHQWFIALLHIKRGTKNLYTLGMMNRVQQLFLAKCMEHYTPDKAQQVFSAFLRVSGAVAALIAQCYDVVVDSSVREGMQKVGVNTALLERIKNMQIKKC